MSPRLAFAVEAAYRAGRSTLAHFKNGVAVENKEDSSPVTVADRGAERLIREAISSAYPGESILGEEEGGEHTAPNRWVVDPIDGTKSFVCGVPLYATLLSYEEEGEPVLGVAYFPALDEMLCAEKGQGATWNGRPCRVSTKPTLTGAYVASGSPGSMVKYGRWEGFKQIVDRAAATRTWGDAYGYALVATGRVEAMIDPIVNPWDISAVALIVREAGGRFTDLDGNDKLSSHSVGSNALVHEEVLRAFR